MIDQSDEMIRCLDDRDPTVRLEAVRKLVEQSAPVWQMPAGMDVNTTYSFSPYTPTRAAWESKRAGLALAGIMDHDTVAGVPEFRAAAHLVGLPVTAGVEMRVSFAGTDFAQRLINHPDQKGAAYLALHALSCSNQKAVATFFQPVRAAREARNRIMAGRLDRLARAVNCTLDYEQDVLPLTEASRNGTVTERHLLYALAHKLDRKFIDRAATLEAMRAHWGLITSVKTALCYQDLANPHYLYDLLGLFKRALLPRVYEPATKELIPIAQAIAYAKKYDLLAAYPYLGDVDESVTGDKAAQCFEDAYLDELFALLHDLGMRAVTYMPSRNTPSQLARVQKLCRRFGFLEICGEDINQPAQPFVCQAMRHPAFASLHDAAWALIGHEQAVTEEPGSGLFSARACALLPSLTERVASFAKQARKGYAQ